MVVNSSLVAVSLWICSSSSLYSLLHWLTCSEIAAIVLILLLCSSLEIFNVVPTLIPKIKDKAAAIVLFLFSLTAVTIFSLIVLYFGFTKHKIDRKEGIIMLLLYVAYLAYIIIR